MKLRILFGRSLALLLLCAMLLSVIPTAFAENDNETETEPLTATFTNNTETGETAAELNTEAEADAETRTATRAATVTPVQNSTLDYSGQKVVGFWLNPSAFTVNQTNIQNLVNSGVTDIYVLVKGTDGGLTTSTIKNIITYAGSSARVHAWMMVARDEYYIDNVDSSSPAWHFRVGTSSEVYRYINLRDTDYQDYFVQQVTTLVDLGVAGIHLDTIRYGTLYYDWGANARTELTTNYGMTKAQYNAATLAMCVTAGYKYYVGDDGYYRYSASGTTATGVNFANALAGNGSTDAYNGAKKFAQMRTDTITNFVKVVRNKITTLEASKNKDIILSCAIMPEVASSEYDRAVYGQDASLLASYVDYVTPMAYVQDYYAANGNTYNYSWPANLAKSIAKQGCNVVVGLQGYANEGSYQTGRYPKGEEAVQQTKAIDAARETINADPSYAGDILGFAVFRVGSDGSAYARTRYWPGSKTININLVNCTGLALNEICIQLPVGVIVDTTPSTTGTVLTPDSEWTAGSAHVYSFKNQTIASYGKKDLTIAVCNEDGTDITTAQAKAISMDVAVKIFSSTTHSYTGNTSDRQYCCFTNSFDNGNHTSCTFTSEVAQAPTCSAAGYRLYTCSTCGYQYSEYLASADNCHSYDSNGVCTGCGKQTYPVLLHFYTGTDELNWSWQFTNGTSTTVSFRDTDKNGIMYAETGATSTNPFFTFTNTVNDLHGIQSGDIVEIRYRVSNTSASAMTPIFRVQTEGSSTYDGQFTASSAVRTGSWQVIQIPIDTANVLGKTIERLSFTPGQSNLALKCEIDYIYIGQPSTAPVMLSFIKSDGTVWQDNPVAYGSKGAFFGDPPARTGYTFIGWRDRTGKIVDPTSMTFTEDTSFYAAYTYDALVSSDDPFVSTKTLTDPTAGDESYQITLDAYTYGQSYSLETQDPLNICIVLDRSGSMSFPAGTNDQAISDGSTSALTTALNKLDKTKPEGYYVATNWLSVPYYSVSEYGYGFVSFEPMRYNSTTKTWQVWQTLSTDELKTYANNSASTTDSWDIYCTPFGIVPSSSGSFKNCNEDFGAWVDVTTAFSDFATRRNACSGESRLSGVTLSTIKYQISVPRRSVMMDALDSFIDSVYESSKGLGNGKTHRISVVSYGQGAFVSGKSITHGATTKNYYDSYSLVSKANIALNSDANVNTLKTIVENHYSYGTTRTDAAFEAAETYMETMASSNADAKGVVILATDGVPTSASAFEDTIANAAITYAKAMKDKGYQIFTIGYVNGLDSSTGYNSSYSSSGTDIQKANNFMHLVSSNFPNALSMSNPGMDGHADSGYYYSTADGSGLASQLETILTSTTTTETATVDGNIQLYDVLKREWTLDNVEVLMYPYEGAGQFAETGTALDSSKYTLTQEEIADTDGDIAISVIWNDARNAYLRESTAIDSDQGYKLVVLLTISVNRDKTLGGNNIPTNGSDSGAYYPSKDDPKLSVIYDVPNVNVPIRYDVKVHDYFMDLYTQDSTDLDLLAIQNDGADASGVFADMFTRTVSVDGLNNRFVTISHAVKDSGSTTRYSYNLYENTHWIPGKNLTGFDFASDDTCTVSFAVKPKTTDADTLGNPPVSTVSQTKTTYYYAPKFAVVDFGTRISIPLGNEAGLSPVSDYLNESALTYSSGSILKQIEAFNYTVTAINTPKGADSNTVQRTAHIIPANTVWYESYGFLTLGEGWTDEGTFADWTQTYDNSAVHGFDAALEANASGETWSYNHSHKANVTEETENNNKSMTFSFTGTGFDVISQTGPDEGVMVVEVYSDEAMQTVVKRYLVDNYLEGDTIYQIPVVHCLDLDYGTYYVKIRAYYNDIFNHNYAATRAILTEAKVRAILGLSADDILECSFASNSQSDVRSATRSAGTDTDYDVHVDAVRIYNTLGQNLTEANAPVACYAYGLADEVNPSFSNIREMLLDADSWTGTDGETVSGVVYIAADGADTEQSDTVTGIHLNMSGVMNHETFNGVNYLLNTDDQRITHPTYGTDVCFKLVNGKCQYYCLDEGGNEVSLTNNEVGEIIGKKNVVYYNSNYDVNGPKNEVYLKDNNGVAFNVGSGTTRVLISVKSVNGKNVYLQAYDSEQGQFVNVFPFENARVCTGDRTEMYYDVTDYVTSDGDIFIRNANPVETVDGVSANADGILSLCNIKLIGGGEVTASAGTLSRAVTIFKGPAEPDENCLHETPEYHTAVPASCTEVGNTEYWYCALCGKYFSDENCTAETTSEAVTIIATGHTLAPVAAVAATCTTDGNDSYYACSMCNSLFADAEGTTVLAAIPTISATGHSYTYTNNGDGTHTVGCANCDYSAVEGHSFVDGTCVCGATEAPVIPTDSTLVYRVKSLSLQSYVAENLMVQNKVINNFDGGVYVVFERYDYKDQAMTTQTVYGVPVTGTTNTQFEYKVFSYMMADEITATLYGVKGGVTYKGESYTTSVANYVMTKMAAGTDAYRTLYANMLNYGANAQRYYNGGYNTDNLATSVLGEYASYITAENATTSSIANEIANDGATVTKQTVALGIADSVQLQYILRVPNALNVNDLHAVLTFTRADGTVVTQTLEGSELVSSGSTSTYKRYTAVFNSLTAKDGRVTANITVYDANDNPVSNTWVYSIESYIAEKSAATAGTVTGDTLQALMNYLDAASAVFN